MFLQLNYLLSRPVLRVTLDTIDQYDYIMLYFYNSNCKTCESLSELWDSFGENYDRMPLGEVNCAVEKELCSQFLIEQFPSIRFVTPSDTHSYLRPNNVKEMMRWVDAKLDQVCWYKKYEEIEKNAHAAGFANFVVLYTNTILDFDFLKPLTGDHFVGCVQQMKEGHDIADEDKKIVMVREGVEIKLGTSFGNSKKLLQFALENSIPFFPEFSQYADQLQRIGKPTIIIGVNDDESYLKQMREAVVKLITTNKTCVKAFNFAYSKGKTFFQNNGFKLNGEFPIAVVPINSNKYQYFTEQNFEGGPSAFINKVADQFLSKRMGVNTFDKIVDQ